jgi:hypothetical protein
MIWNEIRNHLRERLPAIVDFILYIAAMTMIAAVLLGLSWLYVEYGMALFLVGAGLICLVGLLGERRRPVYFEGEPLRLGGNTPVLPPPGEQALPARGPRQIGRATSTAGAEGEITVARGTVRFTGSPRDQGNPSARAEAFFAHRISELRVKPRPSPTAHSISSSARSRNDSGMVSPRPWVAKYTMRYWSSAARSPAEL